MRMYSQGPTELLRAEHQSLSSAGVQLVCFGEAQCSDCLELRVSIPNGAQP